MIETLELHSEFPVVCDIGSIGSSDVERPIDGDGSDTVEDSEIPEEDPTTKTADSEGTTVSEGERLAVEELRAAIAFPDDIGSRIEEDLKGGMDLEGATVTAAKEDADMAAIDEVNNTGVERAN